jgi:MoaA/NifB/PqqE/SkfB family radical SAM enzyme
MIYNALRDLLVYHRHRHKFWPVRNRLEKSLLNHAKKLKEVKALKISTINLQTNNQCPRQCPFCCNKAQKPLEEMSMDLFRKIVDDIRKLDYPIVLAIAMFNDSFAESRIVEMVEYASTLKGKTLLLTNAIKMDTQEAVQLLGKYKNLCIEINTYGDEKIYQKVCYLKNHPRVTIRTITEPDVVWNLCGNVPSVYDDKLPLKQFCSQLFVHIGIDIHGRVVCNKDFYSEEPFGNLNKESLINIWNGKKLQRRRAELLIDKRCGICAKCDALGYVA